MPRVNPTKVLVQDITELESKSKAGLIIPDQVAKKVTMKGKIIIKRDATFFSIEFSNL